MVAIVDDAERWFERCKRIVGYLWACTRHGREQCRLAGIGQSYESYVSKELELENDGHLLHRLTGLCIARSLVGSRTELEVAQSATTALEQQHLLSVVHDVAHILAGFGIVHHRSARYVDVNVLAVLAVALVASAVAAVFGKHVALELEVKQRPVVVVAAQIDAATVSAVASVGSAVRVVLYMAQVH